MKLLINEDLKKGHIILAPLSYSDLANEKLRPSLVLYHDMDVSQLTVAYISSMVLANPGPYDIVIPLGTPMSARAGSIYKYVVTVAGLRW
jgi:hypothetical protein